MLRLRRVSGGAASFSEQRLIKRETGWILAKLIFVVATFYSAACVGAEEPIVFNRDIRPILAENCFYCHGQDANKRESDLRLDHRDAAIDYGAIVPHQRDESLLLERINSDEEDLVMPPVDSNRQLSPQQKALIDRWVVEGAKYDQHWAFERPVRPLEPVTEGSDWARNAIDRFVLAKMASQNLKPSPEADRVTLIKRLSIDLIGLPPTPEEVDAFVADASANAYGKLVDRLLHDPHYGERMALPWLDAARYADSNGFQQDGDTWQWIWRDWVVGALNDDMPFDQFTILQLAGDLIPEATVDQKIASGFNRNHLLNGEGGAIAEEQRFVILFDRIDTTATTWLGLTMACAQCHDHKYDPVTRKDYYSMLDAFNRVPERGTPQRFSTRIRVGAPFLELPTDENKKRIADFNSQIADQETETQTAVDAVYSSWRNGVVERSEGQNDLPESLLSLLVQPTAERSEEDAKNLENELRKHFDAKLSSKVTDALPSVKKAAQLKKDLAGYRGDQIPRVMIMSDASPRETSILERGEYLKPTEKVSFATPAFLPEMAGDLPKNRLGLAKWLVSAEHPLTARVQVNRMWQYFFGAGIVKSTEDLGVQSEYPIHKDLLDWLAVEFQESG